MDVLYKKLCYKLCKLIIKNKMNKEVKYDVGKQREIIKGFMIKLNRDVPNKIYKLIYLILKIERSAKTIKDISYFRKHQDWPVYLCKEDITNIKVDVIVNCASPDCLGCFNKNHKCLDQRVHLKAGPLLRRECRKKLNGKKVRVGQIFVTKSYMLPCRRIIHAVTPQYSKVSPQNHNLVKCYINSLEYCKANGYKSIVFPCLATDNKRFPIKDSAITCMANVKSWMFKNDYKMDIIFCTHTLKHYATYNFYLEKVFKFSEAKYLSYYKPDEHDKIVMFFFSDTDTDSDEMTEYEESILSESEWDIDSPNKNDILMNNSKSDEEYELITYPEKEQNCEKLDVINKDEPNNEPSNETI